MTRREAALSAVAVFAIAVAVRWYAATLVVFPKPEDTAYYVDVARNLLAGRGLVSDALWSFQTPPLVVPRAAFEVWLPLPTFAAALPMAIFGSAFAAAQVSSVVIGALVPVLAWRLAADVADERQLPPGRARTLAIGTGITAAVSLPLILHSTLPDSTMPFAALTLAAVIVMTRIGRRMEDTGSAGRRPTAHLVTLGLILGLAALTRNEALWLGLVWAAVAMGAAAPRRERVLAVLIPAVVALAIFAPWMVRDQLAFGSPLPGQALTNALSIEGTDIFAWKDPPTLGRYLAIGLPRLVELRVTGVGHNLIDVLLLPGAPLSFIGLLGLPLAARLRSVRPLVLISVVIFLETALLFPVSTTWGTFLHAAGAIHVLLIVSSLLLLDAAIVAVGRRRGWYRPVAWLAPALTTSGAILFSALLLPVFGDGAAATQRQFVDLDGRLSTVGLTADAAHPLVTDAPIWLPYTRGGAAVALPYETPTSVLDLARRFGAPAVVSVTSDHPFRAAITAGVDPAAHCFQDVTPPSTPALDGHAGDTLRVYRVSCP